MENGKGKPLPEPVEGSLPKVREQKINIQEKKYFRTVSIFYFIFIVNCV